jgi:hypothetical protein
VSCGSAAFAAMVRLASVAAAAPTLPAGRSHMAPQTLRQGRQCWGDPTELAAEERATVRLHADPATPAESPMGGCGSGIGRCDARRVSTYPRWGSDPLGRLGVDPQTAPE